MALPEGYIISALTGKKGADGTAAKFIEIEAPNGLVFKNGSPNSLTLNALTVGFTPSSYVWKKNGTVISGQTGASLTVAKADVTSSATYSVEADGCKDYVTLIAVSDGATGKGISSTAVKYVSSTNGTTAPSSGWQDTIPSVEQGSYLWTRTVITYSDATTSTSYAVARQGDDGTSVTITSKSVKYQAGTSGTTKPTGTWSTTVPSVSKGQYLWTQTIVNYSDGQSTEAYSVAYEGNNGTNGTSPYACSLSNENFSIATDTDLKPLSVPTGGYSCKFTAYKGSTQLSPIAPSAAIASGKFKISTPSSAGGITVAQGTNGTLTFTPSTSTAITENQTFSVTVTYDNGSTEVKEITISASKTGEKGDKGDNSVTYEIDCPMVFKKADTVTFNFFKVESGVRTAASVYARWYYSTDGSTWTEGTGSKVIATSLTTTALNSSIKVKCEIYANSSASTALDVEYSNLVTDGTNGARGSVWYTGNKITGTSTTATIFSGSGITDAKVGDMYKNTDTSYTYQCTVAGNASTAKWVYTGNMKGGTGSAATNVYLGNENITLACDKDGKLKSALSTTVKVGAYTGTARVASTITENSNSSNVTVGTITNGTTSADGSVPLTMSASVAVTAGELVLKVVANSITFYKTVTISVAKDGQKGDPGAKGADASQIGENLLHDSKLFGNVYGSSYPYYLNINNGTKTANAFNGFTQTYCNNSSGTATKDFLDWRNIKGFTLGDKYTLSFWAKGSGKFYVYWYGESGYVQTKRIASSDGQSAGSFGDGSTTFTLTSEWKQYWVTWQLNSSGDNTKSKYLLFRAYAGAQIYIAGPKFEKGETATAWVPHVDEYKGETGNTGTKTFFSDYARTWTNTNWNTYKAAGYATTWKNSTVEGMRVGDILVITATLSEQGNIIGTVYTQITSVPSSKVDGYYNVGCTTLYGMVGQRGQTGATGTRGNITFVGTEIYNIRASAVAYSLTTASTGITGTDMNILVGDRYINSLTYDVWKCTTAGTASTAKWTYEGRQADDKDNSNQFRFFGDGTRTKYNTVNSSITQSEVSGTNPFGGTSKLWKVTRPANTSASGNATPYTKGVKIESGFNYRYACYVKRTTSSFTDYFGARGYTSGGDAQVLSLSGASVNSAYFTSTNNFGTLNRWYLVIGYVTANGVTTAPSGSGVYDMVTKKKVKDVTNFQFKNITEYAHTGTLIGYTASATTPTAETSIYISDIRFDKLDGTEPSLEELLNLNIEAKGKGTYTSGTTYNKGDIVYYNGNSYICKVLSTTNVPTTTADWDLVAERGSSIYKITTEPTAYTTAIGGFTPAYRISLATVKSQSGATKIIVGDILEWSYYHYPVGYVDADYVYLGTRVTIRGAPGAQGVSIQTYQCNYGSGNIYLYGLNTSNAFAKTSQPYFFYNGTKYTPTRNNSNECSGYSATRCTAFLAFVNSAGATWASGVAYKKGDLITYTSGSTGYGKFICTANHTSSDSILPTNTSYWRPANVLEVYIKYSDEYVYSTVTNTRIYTGAGNASVIANTLFFILGKITHTATTTATIQSMDVKRADELIPELKSEFIFKGIVGLVANNYYSYVYIVKKSTTTFTTSLTTTGILADIGDIVFSRGVTSSTYTTGTGASDTVKALKLCNGYAWEDISESANTKYLQSCQNETLLALAACAKVYKSNNLAIPDACGTVIDLLIANTAVIEKLVAQEAFIEQLSAVDINFKNSVSSYKDSGYVAGDLAISMGKNPKNSSDTDLNFIIQSYRGKMDDNDNTVWNKELYTKYNGKESDFYLNGMTNSVLGFKTLNALYAGSEKEVVSLLPSGNDGFNVGYNPDVCCYDGDRYYIFKNVQFSSAESEAFYVYLADSLDEEFLMSYSTGSVGRLYDAISQKESPVYIATATGVYYFRYDTTIGPSDFEKIANYSPYSLNYIDGKLNLSNAQLKPSNPQANTLYITLYDGQFHFYPSQNGAIYGLSEFTDGVYTACPIADSNVAYQSTFGTPTIVFYDKNMNIIGSKTFSGIRVRNSDAGTISQSSTIHSHNGMIYMIAKCSGDNNLHLLTSSDCGTTWREGGDWNSRNDIKNYHPFVEVPSNFNSPRFYAKDSLIILKEAGCYIYSTDNGRYWRVYNSEVTFSYKCGNCFEVQTDEYDDILIPVGNANKVLTIHRIRAINLSKPQSFRIRTSAPDNPVDGDIWID